MQHTANARKLAISCLKCEIYASNINLDFRTSSVPVKTRLGQFLYTFHEHEMVLLSLVRSM